MQEMNIDLGWREMRESRADGEVVDQRKGFPSKVPSHAEDIVHFLWNRRVLGRVCRYDGGVSGEDRETS
jgi:hypothetical protein